MEKSFLLPSETDWSDVTQDDKFAFYEKVKPSNLTLEKFDFNNKDESFLEAVYNKNVYTFYLSLVPDYENFNIATATKQYLTLVHTLHDIYHIFVCYILGTECNLGLTKSFKDYYPDFSQKLNPDIYFIHNGIHYIIDVSLSVRREWTVQEKTQKYSVISDFLEKKGYRTEIIILVLDKNLTNFEQLNLEILTRTGVSQGRYTKRAITLFEGIFQHVFTEIGILRKFIPDEAIHKDMQILPLPQSKLWNAQDYIKYQSRFEHSKMLQEHNYLSLENCDTLFEQLYNDNEVNNFLKEKRTDLPDAHKSMGSLLNTQPDTNSYKPSFHIAYCPFEDIIPMYHTQNQLNKEQQQVINILAYISSLGLNSSPEIDYLKDIFKLLKDAISDPIATNLFNTGFYTGERDIDSIYKSIYQEMFTKKNLIDPLGDLNPDLPKMKELNTKREEISKKVSHLFDTQKGTRKEFGKVSLSELEARDSDFKKTKDPLASAKKRRQNQKLTHPSLKEYDPNSLKDVTFRQFMEFNGFEAKTPVNILENKTLELPPIILTDNDFSKKSGVDYAKFHPEGRHYTKPTTCPRGDKDIDNFIEILMEKEKNPMSLDPYWLIPVGCDTQTNMNLKQELSDDLVSYINVLRNYNAYGWSVHTRNIANQLMHYSEKKTRNNQIYFSTGGQPNLLTITHGTTQNRKAGLGCPFFNVFITTDKRWCSPVFGDVKVYNLPNNMFLCITGWRRLSSTKLAFLKDAYYTTLSTSYNTWSRIKPIEIYRDAAAVLRFAYIPKLLVGFCTSQVLAEKLMDIKYFFMGMIADYSEVSNLIKDKLSAPYPNCMVWWVVKSLYTFLQKFMELKSKNHKFFNFKTPIYTGFNPTRLRETLGGECDLPSIWSSWTLVGIQDLFDEIFVYSHTMKEPSSLHYESVKAVNTILEFQNKYNNLSIQAQSGLHDFTSFKKNLLNDTKMSCWVDFIKAGTELYLEQHPIKINPVKLKNATEYESLSDITSTKSCIPEYDRRAEKIELSNAKIKRREDLKALRKKEFGDFQEFEPLRLVLKGIPDNSVLPLSYTARYKVHDTILDFMTQNPKVETVLDVAHWNLTKNNCRVTADICIKAQYGAKREFYVVNLGAKCASRILENTFKYIGFAMSEEMISVPGDKKMNHMQNLLDDVIRQSESRDDTLYFVNGDCSKWSASETMSSFWALCEGFKALLPENLIEFCKTTVSIWANKEITIPPHMLENTVFLSGKTEYLKDGTTIKSTQNFLQGMWNYTSSVKAVIATNYSIYMFKKMFPLLYLYCRHLEHSDDYVLIVRVTSRETFEKFRVCHRLAQRLFGINDSPKKTNSQRYIMEFISLMSFGGQLCYPQIKKLKEAGMNTSCIGYRNDATSIISRAGEAIRIGAPICSAYALQKIMGLNLADSYSVLKGQYNGFNWDANIFDRPLELFGLPDCLPIIYTITKGNPDNYRLHKYGNFAVQQMLKWLWLETQKQDQIDLIQEGLQSSSLSTCYTPKFKTKKTPNKVNAFKQNLKVDYTVREQFYNENPEYMVLKPRSPDKLIKWLIYQYYNNSFAMAYSSVSRPQLTLRLSFFVTRPCIVHSHKLYTIKNYSELVYNEAKRITDTTIYDGFFFEQGDTNIEGFFNLTQTLSVLTMDNELPLSNTIAYLPNSYKYLNFENHPLIVLQYVLSPENFENDQRSHLGLFSLIRDKSKFQKVFGFKLKPSELKYVLKKMLISADQNNVGLCYSDTIEGLEGYVINYLENGFYPNIKNKVIPLQQYSVHNPDTGELIYQRDRRFVKTINLIAFENILMLYIFLKKQRFTHQKCLEILNKTQIKNTNMNPLTMLQDTTYSFLKNLGANLQDTQIFSFIKAAFQDDYQPIIEHMKENNFYQFCYNLEITKKSKSQNYPFLESVYIQYKGVRAQSYLTRDKQIICVTDTLNFNYNNILYYISMKLFGLINSLQLEEILSRGSNTSTPLMDFIFLKKHIEFLNLSPIMYTSFDNVVKTHTLKSSGLDKVEPFITVNFISSVSKVIPSRFEIAVTLDLESYSFYNNKLKLYTVPFFRTTHNWVLTMKDDKKLTVGGANIPKMVNMNYILPYLKQKSILVHDITQIFSDSIVTKRNGRLKYPVITNEVLAASLDKLEEQLEEINVPETGFEQLDKKVKDLVKKPRLSIEPYQLDAEKNFLDNIEKLSIKIFLAERVDDSATIDKLVPLRSKESKNLIKLRESIYIKFERHALEAQLADIKNRKRQAESLGERWEAHYQMFILNNEKKAIENTLSKMKSSMTVQPLLPENKPSVVVQQKPSDNFDILFGVNTNMDPELAAIRFSVNDVPRLKTLCDSSNNITMTTWLTKLINILNVPTQSIPTEANTSLEKNAEFEGLSLNTQIKLPTAEEQDLKNWLDPDYWLQLSSIKELNSAYDKATDVVFGDQITLIKKNYLSARAAKKNTKTSQAPQVAKNISKESKEETPVQRSQLEIWQDHSTWSKLTTLKELNAEFDKVQDQVTNADKFEEIRTIYMKYLKPLRAIKKTSEPSIKPNTPEIEVSLTQSILPKINPQQPLEEQEDFLNAEMTTKLLEQERKKMTLDFLDNVREQRERTQSITPLEFDQLLLPPTPAHIPDEEEGTTTDDGKKPAFILLDYRSKLAASEKDYQPFGGYVNDYLNTLPSVLDYLLSSWVGYEVLEKMKDRQEFVKFYLLVLNLSSKTDQLNALEKLALRAIMNLLINEWDKMELSETPIEVNSECCVLKDNTGAFKFHHYKELTWFAAQKILDNTDDNELVFKEKEDDTLMMLKPMSNAFLNANIKKWKINMSLMARTQYNNILKSLITTSNFEIDYKKPFGDI